MEKYSNIRHIIFDWDGTLVDMKKIITQLHIETITAFQLPLPSDDSLRMQLGEKALRVIHNLFPHLSPTTATEYEAEFLKRYQQHSAQIQLIKDHKGLHTLQTLSRSYTLGIASNKRRRLLDPELEKTKATESIHHIAYVDEHPAKPHPSMLEALCLKANLQPEQTLMVGDHANDILAAQALGMHSIGVLTGSYTAVEFNKLQPSSVLNNFTELIHYLGINTT